MPQDKAAPPQPPGKAGSRDERLAEALRANLRRRKAQARGRAGESNPPQGPAQPAGDKPKVTRDD